MKNVLFREEFLEYHTTIYNDTNIILRDTDTLNPCAEIPLNRDRYENELGLAETRPKRPLFVFKGSSTDKKKYDENLNNPLCEVYSHRYIIAIEEYDDKLSLKLFTHHSIRTVGNLWFKNNKNIDYITINKRTGDVYNGYIHGYQKKKKYLKQIRRNNFATDPIGGLLSKIKHIIPRKDGFNPGEFVNNLSNILISSLNIVTPITKLKTNDLLFKFYLDKRDYKYPNNFPVYKSMFIEKIYKKSLKKNGKRLVDSLMIAYGFRGRKLKKALHECHRLNISAYNFALSLFGEDMLNQNEDAIIDLLNFEYQFNHNPINQTLFTREELKRVFNMFIKHVCHFKINFTTFLDHIRFYSELKRFGENDIRWTSDGDDNDRFIDEHRDWSDKIDHYRKGTYFRTYPTYLFDNIEKPIGEYYPVILTNSDEYNQESATQSNCVKGYVDRASSFIISLRHGGRDSEKRATIEYQIKKVNDVVIPHRVQTLGRFNQRLDESWNEVLFKLDEIVLSSFKDERFEPYQIKKICSNSTVLTSGSFFNERGYLDWENNINLYNSIWIW